MNNNRCFILSLLVSCFLGALASRADNPDRWSFSNGETNSMEGTKSGTVWHVTGSCAGQTTRIIEMYVSEDPIQGSITRTLKIVGAPANTSPLLPYIREFTVIRSKEGYIEAIRCLLDGARPRKLDAFLNSDRGAGALRASLLMLLVACGELEWIASEDDDLLWRANIPDCGVKVSKGWTNTDRADLIDLLPRDEMLVAEKYADGLVCIEVPSSSGDSSAALKWYVWMIGDLNQPDGAIMTYGTSIRHFGREFDGILDWVSIARESDSQEDDKPSVLDQLLTSICFSRPELLDLQDVNGEEYLNEQWLWSVRIGDSLDKLLEIGTLHMDPLSNSGTSLRNWRETTFRLVPSLGLEVDKSRLLNSLPELIKCGRNDKMKLISIELQYKSLDGNICTSFEPKYLARMAIGLLLSTGVCDSERPMSIKEGQVLPVGIQSTPLLENSIVLVRTGQSETILLRTTVGELGFNVGQKFPLLWRRVVALSPEYSHAFEGQLQCQWANKRLEMNFIRSGYGSRLGGVFGASPVSKFSTAWLMPNGGEAPIIPQMWLIRSNPMPGYFVRFTELQIKRLSQNKRNSAKKGSKPEVMSQLQPLLERLSVEDAGRVLRALVTVNRAKILWSQHVGAGTTQSVTWEDIAPFLDAPLDDLPRPESGEYVLGDNLSVAPSYVPSRGQPESAN